MVTRYSFRDSLNLWPRLFVFAAVGLILSLFIALTRLNSQVGHVPVTERAAIFAHDSNDAWNRIFC
jgi:hypothetical protein